MAEFFPKAKPDMQWSQRLARSGHIPRRTYKGCGCHSFPTRKGLVVMYCKNHLYKAY